MVGIIDKGQLVKKIIDQLELVTGMLIALVIDKLVPVIYPLAGIVAVVLFNPEQGLH